MWDICTLHHSKAVTAQLPVQQQPHLRSRPHKAETASIGERIDLQICASDDFSHYELYAFPL